MYKNIRSGLFRVFIFLIIVVLVAVPFSSSFFAENSGESSSVSEETVSSSSSFTSENGEPVTSSSEEIVSTSSEEAPQADSSSSITDIIVEYDAQPSSLEQVEQLIKAYNEAVLKSIDAGGDMPQKPRWEFEVSAELMPKGYFSELIQEDPDFEAPYYTFFASVKATAGEWGGLGTVADPYIITDVVGLEKLAADVNGGNTYSGVYFLLANDIDLNAKPWTPIGTVGNKQELIFNHTSTSFAVSTNNAFKGIFDGGGNTVSNFTVGSTSVITGFAADYKGFFGLLDGATVRNLNLQKITVYGGSGLGVLAGYITGSVTIENCNVSDSSLTAKGGGNFGVGGLIGMMDIETGNNVKIVSANVTNTSVISTADYGRVGGLIGTISSYHTAQAPAMDAAVLIEACSVSGGEITVQYYYVGGLIGEINFYNSGGNRITIRDSQTNIPVTTTSASGFYVGGFTGYVIIQVTSPGNIFLFENNSALGDVTGGSHYVGGFGGYTEITSGPQTIATPTQTIYRNCYATGNVKSASHSVGGFIGHTHAGDNMPAGSVLIENCYATGNVVGESHSTGGFVGRPFKNILIKNSYATGDVWGKSNYTGGFIGYAEGNDTLGNVLVENCFSSGNVVGLGFYVGGFIGWLQASQVVNSYSVSSVHSVGSGAGGLIGWISLKSKVTNSYSAGNISFGSTGSIGGLIGGTSHDVITIADCFYDKTTSGRPAGIGTKGIGTTVSITGFNTLGMTTLSNYSPTWKMLENRFGAANGSGNNANPWYIEDEITYPYLYFQYDGKTAADTDYKLGAVLQSDDGGNSFKPLGQFLTDFSFTTTTTNLRFQIKTLGAARVFFPFAHGKTISDYNMFQYKFTDKIIAVPSSGNYSFVSDTPYSLGSISKTGIVAFDSSPYAEKSSDRPVYVEGQTTTYTYVGDCVTYTISIANYSRMFDWRNVVFTDVLVNGVDLVLGSVMVDGVQIGTSGAVFYTYDTTTRKLTVNLADMPKNSSGNPAETTVTFQADLVLEAASVFPLVPGAENIRNRGEVTGDLYQEGILMQSFPVPFDDENTDPVFPKYKVTYNGNGGLSPMGASETSSGFYLPAANHTIEENTFKRNGYYFTKWSTVQYGDGTSYLPGDTIQMDKNEVLYAIWAVVPRLSLYKVDGDVHNAGRQKWLDGAVFTLYKWVGPTAIDYPLLDNEPNWQFVETVETKTSVATFFDLSFSSTYLVVENTAPDGYELPDAQWLFHVTATGVVEIGKMLGGDKKYTIQNMNNAFFVLNYKLSDAYNLPDAGGTGTLALFAIGGILLSVAITGVFILRIYPKRKKALVSKVRFKKSQ